MDYKKFSKQLLDRFNSAKQKRSNLDLEYQDVSDFILINRGGFTVKDNHEYYARNNKVFDGTPLEAAHRLASVQHGGLVNPGSVWFNLKLKGSKEASIVAKRYLEDAGRKMLSLFNGASSEFASESYSFMFNHVVFGTACMIVQEDKPGQVRFNTLHLSEIYLLEDGYGLVDTVFREFKLTLRQIVQRWGMDALPSDLQRNFNKDQDEKQDLIHIVKPVDGNTPLSISNNFSFESIYMLKDKCEILSHKGMYENPYIVSRFSKHVGDAYGRSPALDNLHVIKSINRIKKSLLKVTELAGAPPLLTTDDNVLGSKPEIRPNGIILGGLSYDGTPQVAPLITGSNPRDYMMLLEYEQKFLRQAFFVDQLYFQEGTPITATEAVQRQEARLQLLSPVINRLTIEFLNPLIQNVFKILLRSGILGEPPAEIKEAGFDVEYLSPLSKLQKMQEVQALNRALAPFAPFAQLDPTMFDVVDFPAYLKFSMEAAGVPALAIRTEDEQAAIAEARMQQQQMEQQMQLSAYANQLNKPVQ